MPEAARGPLTLSDAGPHHLGVRLDEVHIGEALRRGTPARLGKHGRRKVHAEGWPVSLRRAGGGPGDLEASCLVARRGREGDPSDHELAVQAVSGLMEVHGRQHGRPAALGLELVGVTAGVVAVQGLLACLLAQLRGGAARRVETSPLQAALFFLTHYFAAATCGDEWQAPAQDAARSRETWRTSCARR